MTGNLFLKNIIQSSSFSPSSPINIILACARAEHMMPISMNCMSVANNSMPRAKDGGATSNIKVMIAVYGIKISVVLVEVTPNIIIVPSFCSAY